jgi:hypothetical protein
MKKKTFMMICLAILGIQVSKAQQSIIALHHEGNVTIFSGSETQEAMEASEKGDTLYFSNGVFSEITITKPVTLMGSGMETFFRNIYVAIPDSVTLTSSLCQNMLIYNFTVNKTVSGMNVSQCKISEVNFSAIVTKAQFISCYFELFNINYNINDMEVVTSKIQTVRGQTNVNNLKFINCNFKFIYNDWRGVGEGGCMATYINCILGGWNNYSGWYNDGTTYVNCLLKLSGSERVYEHSTRISPWLNTKFSVDENIDCSLSDAELLEAGYIGNDGTIVGCNGTDVPFTLELASPHIVDHKVDVDNVNRKLTVTLKMAHEATKKDE